MSESADNQRPLEQLLRRLVDVGLSGEEASQLAAQLNASEDARVEYLQYMRLHADLTGRWGVPTTGVEQQSQVSTPRAPISNHRTRTPSLSWMTPAITFCCGIAIAMLWQNAWDRVPEEVSPPAEKASAIQNPKTPGTAKQTRSQNQRVVTAEAPSTVKDVAVVVRTDGVTDTQLQKGTRLKPGIVELHRGTVQLEFMGGGMVAIKAPAKLNIESRDGGTLLAGQALAHVPEHAKGFVLNAPSVSVVDLNTDFSLSVNENGEAEIGVLRGEVELSLLGDDGSTFVSRTVNESERIRVDKTRRSFEEVTGELDAQLPEITLGGTTSLDVSPQYVDAVIDDGAILYWRFDSDVDGRITNSISPNFHGEIVSDADGESCGVRLLGHARFDESDSSRYIMTSEPIADLNQSEYSIEFWMNPDKLRHASCVGIVAEPNTSDFDHLNVIEIIDDSFPIYQPGSIRFLHRNPPSKWIQQGLNLLSPRFCTPRSWQHVVAVKEMQRISLYFDGELAKSAPIEGHHGEGAFHLLVGQLKPIQPWRQFSGGIDELAVYRRGLTPTEVKRHYDLGLESY